MLVRIPLQLLAACAARPNRDGFRITRRKRKSFRASRAAASNPNSRFQNHFLCDTFFFAVIRMAARIEPLLTIADLDSLPEDGNRYEIIEGELFVSRAPSLIHQRTVGNVLFLFKRYLRRHPVGEILLGPGVIFSDFSGVIPDLVYFSHKIGRLIARGDRITGARELIVEILSPGAENERRDRHAKRQLYKKYGVKEYWVLDPQKQTIEIYRTTRLKLVATLSVGDDLATPLLPGFGCSVKEIFQ